MDLVPRSIWKFPEGRKDGALFAEAVGAFLLEIDADTDPFALFGGLPWCEIGRVTEDQQLRVVDGEREVFASTIGELVQVWERPFVEVVK